MLEHELWARLAELARAGQAACLCTIVAARGSTPRDVGAKMIVTADGATLGTVGGGCGESVVRSAALRALLVERRPRLLEVRLTEDQAGQAGDVCGGTLTFFIDPLLAA